MSSNPNLTQKKKKKSRFTQMLEIFYFFRVLIRSLSFKMPAGFPKVLEHVDCEGLFFFFAIQETTFLLYLCAWPILSGYFNQSVRILCKFVIF